MNDKECWEEKSVMNNPKYFGKSYWLNLETGKSQWGVPLLSFEKLPFGWEKHMSSNFKPYYENINTGQTQWTIPVMTKEKPLIKGWITQKSTQCDNIYYKNIITGETQWDEPLNPGDADFGKPTHVNDLKNLNPDNIDIPWPTDLIELWEHNWELTTKETNIQKSGLFIFNPKNLKIISRFNDKGVTNPKDCYVMMNKCKVTANNYLLTDKRERMPSEITTIASNIQDEIQKAPSLGRRNMFVLPSQLNAAEYPNQNKIVGDVAEYFGDDSGGPRGQLGADLSIAQFIIDMACNSYRPNQGINNVRLMGNINGVTLKNGYLQVKDTADTKQFEKQLSEMTVLGVRDVPVRGLDKTFTKFVQKDHTVDLIYGSAVPIGDTYGYGNGSGTAVKRIAQLTLFAQYVGAMRLAVTRQKCDLILMPLGGRYFVNELENIRLAIINAYKFMEKDLKKADVRVKILAWEGSEKEKIVFK